jgi:hypothetical protein
MPVARARQIASLWQNAPIRVRRNVSWWVFSLACRLARWLQPGPIMTRALLSPAIDSDWRLVSQERPCPVCGGEDTCGVHTVDTFACCARAPSEWKLTNGSWLHRLQPPQTPSVLADVSAHLQPAANANGLRF